MSGDTDLCGAPMSGGVTCTRKPHDETAMHEYRGDTDRADPIYDAALPIAEARKLPRDHPGVWFCRCGAGFVGRAEAYPENLRNHAVFRADHEDGRAHDPGLARFRPDIVPDTDRAVKAGLREDDRRFGQIVLFDVDGVLSDGRIWRRATARPGVQTTLDTLACLGFQLIAWSSGGAEYAQRVCEALVLHGSIWRYASKPAYPMTEEAALAVIGSRPVLQIDDDPTERIADWPFMEWPSFTGPHRLAPSRPAAPGSLDVARLAEAMKWRWVEDGDGDYTAVPPTPSEVAAEYARLAALPSEAR